MKQWYGVFARGGTPPAIVARISADIAKVLGLPDTRSVMAAQGIDPYYLAPAEFGALIKADLAKYGEIVKKANIKLEQ
jgi:tripartite-type tricarboxylate transporter receptor subunit TctC